MNIHKKETTYLTILAVCVLVGGTFFTVNALKESHQADEVFSKIESKILKQEPQSESSITSDKLVNAVMSNEQDKVVEMIQQDQLDINQANSEGVYPLEASLVFENLEMAELLLDNGADPNIVTQNGKSIKEVAMSCNSKMLKELFSKY